MKEPMAVADLTKMLLEAGNALPSTNGRQFQQVVLVELEFDVE